MVSVEIVTPMLDAKTKQREERRRLQKRYRGIEKKEGTKERMEDRLLEGKALGYNRSGKIYVMREKQNEYTC